MTRSTRLTVLIALLVGLAAVLGSVGLVTLDVRAAESATSVDSSASTASDGTRSVDLSGGVVVLVLGEGPDREQSRALVTALRERGVDAVAADDVRGTYDRPVLVVAPVSRSFEWTPVAANADVSWGVLYVQSGDLRQFGASTPGGVDFDAGRFAAALADGRVERVVMRDSTEVVHTAEFALRDDTRGFVTFVAYDRHVDDLVVARTLDALTA